LILRKQDLHIRQGKFIPGLATVLIFTLFLQVSASALISPTDSLHQKLNKYPLPDSTRVDILISLSSALLEKYPDSALIYGREALDISKSKNYIKEKAQSWLQLSNCYLELYEFQQAISYADSASMIFTGLNDERCLAMCKRNAGYGYFFIREFDEAKQYFLEALEYAENSGDDDQIAGLLTNLGNVYYYKGNYPVSLDYYQRSLSIHEKLGNDYSMAKNINNIGLIYRVEEKYQPALDNFLKAYDMFSELEAKPEMAGCLRNIGSLYDILGESELALDYKFRSLKLNQEIGDKRGIAWAYHNIGWNYRNRGENTNAIAYIQKAIDLNREINDYYGVCTGYYELGRNYFTLKNYPQALSAFRDAMALADKYKLLEMQRDVHQYLAKTYEMTGDFKSAYKNHVAYKSYNDSIFNKQDIEKITELKNQYEFEKEKQQIRLEQEQREAIQLRENRIQKLWRNIFIAGFILAGIIALLIYRNTVQKSRANKLLAAQKHEIEKINLSLQERNNQIREQAEELENTNKQLLELSKFKEEMTGMIVHDLKNPLNNIINIPEDIPTNQNKKLRQSGKQMLNLVMNILDVYKYESASIPVNLSATDISRISQQAVEEIMDSANEKNLSIENTIPRATIVHADPELSLRVFINLLTNAVRFAPLNGFVKLKTVAPKPNEKLLRIEVCDNGPGIPASMHQKAFEKYSQADGQQRSGKGSTGLGLAYCKMAVEAQGGTIGVDTSYQNGASIYFTQPLIEISSENGSGSKKPEMHSGLTPKEKSQLQVYLPLFEELEIYQISALRKLVAKIEHETSVNTAWLNNLKNAINFGNEQQLQSIVNLIRS